MRWDTIVVETMKDSNVDGRNVGVVESGIEFIAKRGNDYGKSLGGLKGIPMSDWPFDFLLERMSGCRVLSESVYASCAVDKMV